MLTERNPYDPEQVGHYDLDRMLVAACVQADVKPHEKYEGVFVSNSDANLQRINMIGGAIRARIDRATPPFKPGEMVKGVFRAPFEGPVAHHFKDTGTAFRIQEDATYKVENIFYEGFDVNWLVSFEDIKSDHGLIVKFWAKDFVHVGLEKVAA